MISVSLLIISANTSSALLYLRLDWYARYHLDGMIAHWKDAGTPETRFELCQMSRCLQATCNLQLVTLDITWQCMSFTLNLQHMPETPQAHCTSRISQSRIDTPPESLNIQTINEPLHHYLLLLRYFPGSLSAVWATTHVQGLIMVEACISLTHASNTDSVECRQHIQHTHSQI